MIYQVIFHILVHYIIITILQARCYYCDPCFTDDTEVQRRLSYLLWPYTLQIPEPASESRQSDFKAHICWIRQMELYLLPKPHI